jgi:hypothetical protein
MKQLMRGFFGITALAALVVAPSVSAASKTFDGKVCALVTAAAQQTAGTTAQCVQTTKKSAQMPHATVYVANWGSSAVAGGPAHFMRAQVGPPTAGIAFRTRIMPIMPRWVGPIQLAPNVKGYYALGAYKGVAGGRGTIRFIEHGSLCEFTIENASHSVLPGLEAVAKSAAARL